MSSLKMMATSFILLVAVIALSVSERRYEVEAFELPGDMRQVHQSGRGRTALMHWVQQATASNDSTVDHALARSLGVFKKRKANSLDDVYLSRDQLQLSRDMVQAGVEAADMQGRLKRVDDSDSDNMQALRNKGLRHYRSHYRTNNGIKRSPNHTAPAYREGLNLLSQLRSIHSKSKRPLLFITLE